MSKKKNSIIILIISLFLSGNLISFIGLSKGRDIAITISRPIGANAWETSNTMIQGCTYLPVITGVSLIILSITLITVLFIKWIDKTN